MPHDGWAAAPLAAVGGFRPWKMDPTLALLGCPRPIAIGNPIHLSLYLGLHLHLALPHQATGADASSMGYLVPGHYNFSKLEKRHY
jgi:hypothetical protein